MTTSITALKDLKIGKLYYVQSNISVKIKIIIFVLEKQIKNEEYILKCLNKNVLSYVTEDECSYYLFYEITD